MSVVALNDDSVSVEVLLNQIAASTSPVDALVCVIRRDGRWETCWTSHVDLGNLSMATMKLLSDVTEEMHRARHEPRDFGSAG